MVGEGGFRARRGRAGAPLTGSGKLSVLHRRTPARGLPELLGLLAWLRSREGKGARARNWSSPDRAATVYRYPPDTNDTTRRGDLLALLDCGGDNLNVVRARELQLSRLFRARQRPGRCHSCERLLCQV